MSINNTLFPPMRSVPVPLPEELQTSVTSSDSETVPVVQGEPLRLPPVPLRPLAASNTSSLPPLVGRALPQPPTPTSSSHQPLQWLIPPPPFPTTPPLSFNAPRANPPPRVPPPSTSSAGASPPRVGPLRSVSRWSASSPSRPLQEQGTLLPPVVPERRGVLDIDNLLQGAAALPARPSSAASGLSQGSDWSPDRDLLPGRPPSTGR
jgi:hypothetical protein